MKIARHYVLSAFVVIRRSLICTRNFRVDSLIVFLRVFNNNNNNNNVIMSPEGAAMHAAEVLALADHIVRPSVCIAP